MNANSMPDLIYMTIQEYPGISISDLATKVGLSKGNTIYRYLLKFKNQNMIRIEKAYNKIGQPTKIYAVTKIKKDYVNGASIEKRIREEVNIKIKQERKHLNKQINELRAEINYMNNHFRGIIETIKFLTERAQFKKGFDKRYKLDIPQEITEKELKGGIE